MSFRPADDQTYKRNRAFTSRPPLRHFCRECKTTCLLPARQTDQSAPPFFSFGSQSGAGSTQDGGAVGRRRRDFNCVQYGFISTGQIRWGKVDVLPYYTSYVLAVNSIPGVYRSRRRRVVCSGCGPHMEK